MQWRQCLLTKTIAKAFLPSMIKRFKAAKVSLKGCSETRKTDKSVASVKEEDFYMEYLDLILNVKVVKGIDEAMEPIAKVRLCSF